MTLSWLVSVLGSTPRKRDQWVAGKYKGRFERPIVPHEMAGGLSAVKSREFALNGISYFSAIQRRVSATP